MMIRLREHGYPTGFGGTWQNTFSGMIRALDYPDGGGIIITHPTWFSGLPDSLVCDMLGFDPRVLGIEIYNDLSANREFGDDCRPPARLETEPGFSLCMWDRILSAGMRCWGFCVPDHSVETGRDWRGRIILLIPETTEHNCLKAYRNGQFYGCLKDNGLTITDFTANNDRVSVATTSAQVIRFVTDGGWAKTVREKRAAFELPKRCGRPDLTYVRVEVEDDTGERLFLQPVIYKARRCSTAHRGLPSVP